MPFTQHIWYLTAELIYSCLDIDLVEKCSYIKFFKEIAKLIYLPLTIIWNRLLLLVTLRHLV